MLQKHLTFVFLCFFGSSISTEYQTIKAIFIDIETLFETNDMKASRYVGKIDSVRYLTKVGHLPCQADLFTNLQKAPSQSTQVTYNNDLKMPLVFSDWLMNTQSATTLINNTLKFLLQSNLFDIEKKVLGNVVKMMMTPSHLADTQQVISSTEKLISQLKSQGYKVYLVGNWAHLDSLKQAFNKVFQNIDDVYFSSNIQKIKPYSEFYDTVLQKTNLDKHQAVWIEKENQFVTKAKQHGLKIVRFNKHSMSNDLKALGVKL